MVSNVLKLIFDYSKHGKLADRGFIEKIVEITTNENHLQNYIGNLEFSNKLSSTAERFVLASYNLINYDIVINLNMVKGIVEDATKFDYLFNDFESIIYRNCMVAQALLHEVEHAKQIKESESSRQDLEATLLKICLKDIIAVHDSNVLKLVEDGVISALELINHIYDVRQKQKYFYKEDPTERLAQIKSYSTIVELLKQMGKESSCVLQVEQMHLLKEKIRGYSWKGIYMLPPTLVYLEGTDNIEEWKHFEFYDENNEVLQRKVETKYTLEKRLTLGLPVRKEEYQKVKNSITIL